MHPVAVSLRPVSSLVVVLEALPLAASPPAADTAHVLLWREKIPAGWLPKVLANLPAVLVDHAHLERKAATTALNVGEISRAI